MDVVWMRLDYVLLLSPMLPRHLKKVQIILQNRGKMKRAKCSSATLWALSVVHNHVQIVATSHRLCRQWKSTSPVKGLKMDIM